MSLRTVTQRSTSVEAPISSASFSASAFHDCTTADLALQIRDREQRSTDPSHPEYHKVRQAHLYDMAAQRFRSAAEFAQTAIRSVIIARGGALVAMLAFLGQSRVQVAGCGVWIAFGAFVGGFICSLLVVLCAYQTQSAYARQDDAGSDKIYFHLLGDEAKASEQDRIEGEQMAIGGRWEVVAITMYVIALALFIAGAAAGVLTLTSLPSPHPLPD